MLPTRLQVKHVKGRNATEERQPGPRHLLLDPNEVPGWRLRSALEFLRQSSDASQPPLLPPPLPPTEPLPPARGNVAIVVLESRSLEIGRDAYHTFTIDDDDGGRARVTHWRGHSSAFSAPFSRRPSTWREASVAEARRWLQKFVTRALTRGSRSEKEKAKRYRVVLCQTSWGDGGEGATFEPMPTPLPTASNYEALRSWLAERKEEETFWESDEGKQLLGYDHPRMDDKEVAAFLAVAL